jgi:hypothetical protein
MSAAAPLLAPGVAKFRSADIYPGYRDADFARPFAKYLTGEDTVREAVIVAAHAAPRPAAGFQPFSGVAASLCALGHLPVETGWCSLPSGGAVVAVHTAMPGLRAEMWDWWFAWHGSEPARYKLWAPSAHYAAIWRDGEGERPGYKSYIGRTSLIDEDIGRVHLRGAIRFVEPASIGFPPDAFDGTVICGRAGEIEVPIEHTWLIHQVRNTADGCEMRSRFYLGQDPVNTATGQSLPKAPPEAPRPGPIPAELLVHCAVEMHHLAGFLPALYQEFA